MKSILYRKGLVFGIILLFVGVGVVSSTSNNTVFKKLNTNHIYSPHDPIYINGNNDFTDENGVTGGSGSYNDPYIIEGWEIDTTSHTGIHISNSVVHFIIKNCYIHGDGVDTDGIWLDNVEYGTIEECIITNNENGIIFIWNTHSIIKNNTIKNNTYCGILYDHCYFNHINNTIYQNNINSNWIGIWLLTSEDSEIFSNNFMYNVEQAIYLETCLCGGAHNKIYHNNFIYNGEETGQAYCDNGWSNYWNDSYPSGGNYWSDYNGTDNDGDEIGDTPYQIPDYSDNTWDNYPLMYPTANVPPNKPSIDGPISGKPRVEYEYSFNATDLNDDAVMYKIDWGDDNTDWTEYGDSGEEIILKHTWEVSGNYTIKVQAIDFHGAESDWSEFVVIMPKSKTSSISLFQLLLERFPLLQKLLQQLSFGL